MRKYPIILLVIIAAISCKKEKPLLLANPGTEYFPNTVGDYWKYKVVDSFANTTVFVEVNIVGNTFLPGGQEAMIWTYRFPDHTDTNYVYQEADMVKFIRKGSEIRNAYKLPLTISDHWSTDPHYIFDSTTVVDNRAFQLNDHNYNNSFLIFESGHLPNQYWNTNEWFCPKIGMISKRELNSLLIVATYTVVNWELVEYDLK